jgi:IclR family pca regulon transcriptional regulator
MESALMDVNFSDNDKDDAEPDRDFVRALARGLAVIESFDNAQNGMILSEVAKHTGLSRGTAARLLNTLNKLGYVQADGRTFRLMPRVLRLGYSFLSSQPLWRIAQPILEKAGNEVGGEASLSVLDGHDIVFVFTSQLVNHSTIRYIHALGVGMKLPAFCTSAGRVMLAGLPERELDAFLAAADLQPRGPTTITDPGRLRDIIAAVRENGYAIQDEEITPGVRGIAVPVCDAAGAPIAAISVTAVIGRTSQEEFAAAAAPVLKREAEALRGLVSNVRR